ncbi:MAG: inositol monophosphatase [Dehalococcoidia bacterium]|nr:MAG: inositol monophosphatase [Dehalococcoidia bacterium]
MSIGKRKEIAIKAAREAGAILLANFGRKIRIKSKGDRDLVTNVDKLAEKTIIQLIRKYFPEDGILSEETPRLTPSNSGFRWIIDPIDGTHNFIHRIAAFGTSIALEFKGEVILGVIYMPYTDELYIAQKGKGSFCNGKGIHVSERPLKEATLVYDSSIRFNKNEMLKGLGRLADKAFNMRMFGSTVRGLTYVAEGKAEAEIEFNDKLWDFAAGLLLVEEAGGRSTDCQGGAWNVKTGRYIASNAVVHEDILKLMKG